MEFAKRRQRKNQLISYHPHKFRTVRNLELPEPPSEKYRTIVIDPPWPIEKIVRGRRAAVLATAREFDLYWPALPGCGGSRLVCSTWLG